MNTVRSKLWTGLSVFVNNGLQVQCVRGYAVKKTLPIEWVRPKPPMCYDKHTSGDLGIDFDVKPEDAILGFEKSKELQDADELIKKIVSVKFNPGSEGFKLTLQKATDIVKRHAYDTCSMEATLAKLTARILKHQEWLEKHPYDKQSKVICKEAIERRQKYLKKLRERDYACFEYLIERLNLKFHPGIRPEHFHMVERKWGTKQLLQKYCDKVRQEKLDTYRKSLEAQQKDFFRDKAEKLEFIRNEEIACGVEPTVTEEEIIAAKDKAASFA